MLVKVIGIDRASGKVRLSRREALGKTPDVVHNLKAGFRRRKKLAFSPQGHGGRRSERKKGFGSEARQPLLVCWGTHLRRCSAGGQIRLVVGLVKRLM